MVNEVRISGDTSPASAVRKSEQLGRLKLMLRLPAQRTELEEIGTRESALDGLFDAYNEATDMLHRLLQVSPPTDGALALEYRKICSEIEADVVRYLLDRAARRSVVPQ
jgi:hypothetical protein